MRLEATRMGLNDDSTKHDHDHHESHIYIVLFLNALCFYRTLNIYNLVLSSNDICPYLDETYPLHFLEFRDIPFAASTF